MKLKPLISRYEIEYNIYIDGKFEKQGTRIIEAATAADAVAMFDFWARGECNKFGCEIVGAKIVIKGFVV